MLTKNDIKYYCNTGDIVQFITPDTSGIGQVSYIGESSLKVSDHGDEALALKYGDPVPFPTVIPLQNINLLLIIQQNHKRKNDIEQKTKITNKKT